MSRASNYVHLQFDEIVKRTDKALLVRFDGEVEEWIPLSQISDPEDYLEGEVDGEISVTEWIAKQKNL